MPRGDRLRGWLVVVLWCVVSTALVSFAPGRVVTEVIVVPCVLVAPGIVVVRLLRLHGVALVATVLILVALAVGVLVPAVFLYAGVWSPQGSFATIVTGTIVAACGGILADAGRLRWWFSGSAEMSRRKDAASAAVAPAGAPASDAGSETAARLAPSAPTGSTRRR